MYLNLQPYHMLSDKKALLVSFLILYFSSLSYSQPLLVPFRNGKLWGYADTNGIIRIKPAFDKADFFDYPGNTAVVHKNQKISLIDIHGQTLFPFSDSYTEVSGDYIITYNKKKGIYTKQGVQLVPIEYDQFDYTSNFKEYSRESDKIVGIKNNEYFLIDLQTGHVTKIPKPGKIVFPAAEGVAISSIDLSNTVAVPNPQFHSTDFPKLKGHTDLVHCKTLYLNHKPVFYVFCVWKNREIIGYMGENGIPFFKDDEAQRNGTDKSSPGTAFTHSNCNSNDIELMDSCLLGLTIEQAIKKMNLDSTNFGGIVLFAREVHGIYIRLGDSCKITVIVDNAYSMNDDQLNAIETKNRTSRSWRGSYKYILNEKIVGICWRKDKVRKVRVLGNMKYHDCLDF